MDIFCSMPLLWLISADCSHRLPGAGQRDVPAAWNGLMDAPPRDHWLSIALITCIVSLPYCSARCAYSRRVRPHKFIGQGSAPMQAVSFRANPRAAGGLCKYYGLLAVDALCWRMQRTPTPYACTLPQAGASSSRARQRPQRCSPVVRADGNKGKSAQLRRLERFLTPSELQHCGSGCASELQHRMAFACACTTPSPTTTPDPASASTPACADHVHPALLCRRARALGFRALRQDSHFLQ